jgi:hypothetical protein
MGLTGLRDRDRAEPWVGFARAALAALLVIASYQLPWHSLKLLTSEAVLDLSQLLGMTVQRLSDDTISLNGDAFRFATSCTFVDVFAGSIALLWSTHLKVTTNLLRLAAAAGMLFVFDVTRLELSHLLFWAGLPWIFAHEWLSGVAYFIVFLAVWQHRGWLPDPGALSSAENAIDRGGNTLVTPEALQPNRVLP